jgi:plastocyanin
MDEQNTAAKPSGNKMPMILIGLVALVLIGGIGYVASQSGSKTEEMTQTPQQQTTETSPATESMNAEETTEPVAQEGQVQEFTVEASNFKFSLNEIKVKQGDTVRINFVNTQGFHDFVLGEFNAKTQQLAAGKSETVEFVADKTGTFEYYCSVGQHRQMGMKGNLIVE